MNEASLTRALHMKFRKRGYHDVKHCDQFTSGIPDSSFTYGRETVWVEIKHLRKGRTLWQELRDDQFVQLRKLSGFIVAYSANGQTADVYMVYPNSRKKDLQGQTVVGHVNIVDYILRKVCS